MSKGREREIHSIENNYAQLSNINTKTLTNKNYIAYKSITKTEHPMLKQRNVNGGRGGNYTIGC